jgi:hypothetical protein
MVGAFVMTENELLKKKPTPDSVGMGSYTIDSHNIQRYVMPEGFVQNEGDIGVGTKGPYEIAYGSLVPKRGQCANLFVPVAMSASHIAYGSIRMEPVFMILGQSAATAASLAIDAGIAVQEVPYARLREVLQKDGQVLEYTGPRPAGGVHGSRGLDPKTLGGVVVDDSAAKLTGEWKESGAAAKFVGDGYRHDQNARDGKAAARFEAKLPKSGRYEVRLAWPPNSNRASKVAVEIEHASGREIVTIDQKNPPGIDGLFHALGTFPFGATGAVGVINRGTDGYLVIDAVQWLPASE